jgi:hypothetical protein
MGITFGMLYQPINYLIFAYLWGQLVRDGSEAGGVITGAAQFLNIETFGQQGADVL